MAVCRCSPRRNHVICLAILQFLAGFQWATQRPQGFLIILFRNAGLSENQVGLVSFLGLLAPILGSPLAGFCADRVMSKYRVLAAGVLTKSLLQLALWPVLLARLGFWACLGFVMFYMFWNTDGVLAELTIQRLGKNNFGKVRLWGGVGFATGSLLTGLLASVLHMGVQVVFIESAVTTLIYLATLRWLAQGLHQSPAQETGPAMLRELAADTRTNEDVSHRLPDETHSGRPVGLLQFLCRIRMLHFLFIVLALGLCEGVMQSYTYVQIGQLPHGNDVVMGFSAVFMIISEIPFFYYAGPLTERFRTMQILGFALACSALRQLWISLLWDAWWVLPGELLHGITFSIANAAVVLYSSTMAPEKYKSTMQSIVQTVFAGLGQGSSSWLGGLILGTWGVVFLFRVSAAFAFGCFVVLIGPALIMGV